MNIQNLQDNRGQIIEKYNQLGGIDGMLKEFMTTLKEAVDFGLNESDDPLDLVDQFFNDRYTGAKEKKDLRETMGSIALRNEREGKTWNPVTREWK